MFPGLGEHGEVFVFLAASAVFMYLAARWMRHRRTNMFEKVGTVSRILFYPVKSCKELEIEEAECTPLGLLYDGIVDRQWMVVKSDGHYVSRTLHPKMVFISVKALGDTIRLEAPGKQPITLPKHQSFNQAELRNCSVLGVPVQGIDCGNDVAAWISDVLETKGLRLVCYSGELPAKDCTAMVKAWGNNARPGDMAAYTNYCPYMTCSQSSLTAINEHLDKPVSMANFRPNIVVQGPPPYDEDTWEEIRIGSRVQMRCLEACGRCPMITIDTEDGTKYPEGEPYTSLRKHRLAADQKKPKFGVNMAGDVYGIIRLGDPVYVLRKSG